MEARLVLRGHLVDLTAGVKVVDAAARPTKPDAGKRTTRRRQAGQSQYLRQIGRRDYLPDTEIRLFVKQARISSVDAKQVSGVSGIDVKIWLVSQPLAVIVSCLRLESAPMK
jgi:hypothetical protein